jgi:hypothetical protein
MRFSSVLSIVCVSCALLLAGCGGGGGDGISGQPATPTGGDGPTLAISPAAPPLMYTGPVAVNFVSFAAEPVTNIYLGSLALEGLNGPQLGGGGYNLGTLTQTGMYTLRVDFDGRSSFAGTLYAGWSNITIYLFP